MSKITIKNLATYQELSQAASTEVTGGTYIYGPFDPVQATPVHPVAHQVGSAWGNYWGTQLDNAANYGAPGAFSEMLYGEVMPFMLYGIW